jgi:hypothetical protein
MHLPLFERLNGEGLISDSSLERIKSRSGTKIISVYWDLKTILYLGVLLLTSGLGVLVYKNIDSIGHLAVISFIALISAAGYFYCFRNKPAFSTRKLESTGPFFDYTLLLAALCFIIFIGYWQFQYDIFGSRLGLASSIPMLVLFFTAYAFDHLGILCLAITNLAAWAGIEATPSKILRENDFNSGTLIITGLLLGIFLLLAAKASLYKNIKAHFAFTYMNFGMHILFISCLAGLFHFESVYLLWLLLLMGLAFYFYRESVRDNSFYFLLVLSLYGYIGISYSFIHLPFWNSHFDLSELSLICLYFIGSGTGLILFLMRMNKKFKTV